MLQQVPTVRTSFQTSDFISALIKAWYGLYNAFPTKEQIGVIYSQWGVETGLGTYCWNNNIGNVKAVDQSGVVVEYCALNGVWEIINGQRVTIPPENPGAWFRSFPTLDSGVAWFIGFLRNARYKVAWTAVEQGSPAQFAHLLKQQGYYTASEASYVQAMQYYFNKFMKDATFDTVLQGITAQQPQPSSTSTIEFPSDYQPLNFDVKDNAFNRSDYTHVSHSALNAFAVKVQNIFSR